MAVPLQQGRLYRRRSFIVAGEGRVIFTDTEGRNRGEPSEHFEIRDPILMKTSESLTYGFHDTWVTGFEKELASSTSGSVDPDVRSREEIRLWVSKFSNKLPAIHLLYQER